MFNSLATFLFGAQATSEPSDNCVENPVQQQNNKQPNEDSCAVAAGDVIEVTSSTPSVAGNQRGNVVQRSSNGSGNGSGKRSGAKQRRARQRQQQKEQQKESQQAPSITKLLTPNGESSLEEDFNEDEWYIVEKEGEYQAEYKQTGQLFNIIIILDGEEDSLPRSDSEEEQLSVVESKPAASSGTSPVPSGSSYRRRQLHLQTHSLYSGPRPHQHRNRLTRTLNIRVPLTMSALSPPRIVPISDATSNGHGNGGNGSGGDDSDNSLTQSLYAPPSALSPCNSESSDGSSTGHGSVVQMEESWYVTPPPCFTSIGPINMEASPFENLLIEHPRLVIFVLNTHGQVHSQKIFPKPRFSHTTTHHTPHTQLQTAHAQHCVYLICHTNFPFFFLQHVGLS